MGCVEDKLYNVEAGRDNVALLFAPTAMQTHWTTMICVFKCLRRDSRALRLCFQRFLNRSAVRGFEAFSVVCRSPSLPVVKYIIRYWKNNRRESSTRTESTDRIAAVREMIWIDVANCTPLVLFSGRAAENVLEGAEYGSGVWGICREFFDCQKLTWLRNSRSTFATIEISRETTTQILEDIFEIQNFLILEHLFRDL